MKSKLIINWDELEENIYMKNGKLTYESILLKTMTREKLDRVLSYCEDSIFTDEEGEEQIDWYQVEKGVEGF